MKLRTLLLSLSPLVLLPSQAFAHWGHVGELAGHGHVIAIGALVGAAALAAALAGQLRKPKNGDEEEEPSVEIGTEAEGEAA